MKHCRKKYRHCICMGHYKKKQKGGFLNHSNLTYTGRDTVNQFNEVEPGLIRKTLREINQTAKKTNKTINQGSRKIERVAIKIIKIVIEELCKTPFRLLGQIKKK